MLHLRTILVMAVIGAALLMSASAYGATVVIGTVVNASGQPVGGVTVELYDELLLGTDQTLSPVATAVSDSDGTYAIDLAVTSTYTNRAASNGGAVNFDVIVANSTLLAYNGIARYPTKAGSCDPLIRTCRPVGSDSWIVDPDQPDDSGAAGLAAGDLVPDHSATAGSNRLVLRAEVSNGSAVTSSPALAGPCAGIVKTAVGTQTNWGVVGQLHVPKDASATFKYGKSADSDIGIGYSTNDANWSMKGSVHVGNARSAEITLSKSTSATSRYGKRTKSQFKTTKYKYVTCAAQHFWKIIGEKWVAGADWGQDTNEYNGHCLDTYFQYRSSYPEGATFTRNDSNLAKYNGSLDVFGVGLSVQSGASTFVTLHWKMGTKLGTYWLCGNDDFVTDSHRIYAGA
jgi:hypothetical protein